MIGAPHMKLRIWQKAHELAVAVYQISASLPKEEKYGLYSQVRRSAISVPANIAEGLGRYSFKERMRFVGIARGSAQETMEHLLLIRDLGMVRQFKIDGLINEYNGLAIGMSAFIDDLARKAKTVT